MPNLPQFARSLSTGGVTRHADAAVRMGRGAEADTSAARVWDYNAARAAQHGHQEAGTHALRQAKNARYRAVTGNLDSFSLLRRTRDEAAGLRNTGLAVGAAGGAATTAAGAAGVGALRRRRRKEAVVGEAAKAYLVGKAMRQMGDAYAELEAVVAKRDATDQEKLGSVFLGGPYGLAHGKKGKKWRSGGNEVTGGLVGGTGGTVAGGLAGAGVSALSRGRINSKVASTVGSQAGGWGGGVTGAIAGANRNARRGYYKGS